MRKPFARSTLCALVLQGALVHSVHHSTHDVRDSSISLSPAAMLAAHGGDDIPQWENVVNRKRAEREALLPSEWKVTAPSNETSFSPREVVIKSGILSTEELDITDTSKYDLTETAKRIASGNLSAEKVVTAFCKRATATHSLANFLTEINFKAAIERAKELDSIFQRNGTVLGPLHGIPITIKDAMDLEGFAASEGLTLLADAIAPNNGVLIQILIDAGAVIIAKTNMPQTGLAADTNSILWGRTLNAHNSHFGAGGSTGGEGVAMATSSSLFGVGSDGAGSCRMPGHANGAIGFRPSGSRLPPGGRNLPWSPGRGGIGPAAGEGFFAQSVRDLRLVSKLVSDAQPWERSSFLLYPSPWHNESVPKKLRIGVWDVESSNTFIHLFPPVLRGYRAAIDRLREASIELVPFSPPDLSAVWELCKEFLLFQGIEGITELISQEPITEIVRRTGIFIPDTPRFPISVQTLYDLNIQLMNLSSTMDDEWNSSGEPLDALLSVTAANTALPFDQWFDTSYTSIYNSVDFPAINLPLNMTVDRELDSKYENFKPFSPEDKRLEALYDPETFHGLPLSVQLAARKFEDEKLLAIAELIHPIIKAK
ncbi:Amidase family protein [Cordyceps fumosorosea ARSEF 2679]|uniref:Amidase family protein n=1 Tax=Cordyceps fumosorosea (strain ARSEF 2679) TaxID=1081104 RepID=A0A167FJS2_CORFA|nr:Amidase family protein [Cordyceps fumosorosea ARSEF 2679]OAA45372.1 Amidase family protein [Cordyceps fumosorosea ARSEF 2679]